MGADRIKVESDPIDCGLKVWFDVAVYDTTRELQRAAKRYRPHGTDWSGTLGCFHPKLNLLVNDKGKVFYANPCLGIMRLSRQALEPHIIIHECTHAAVNYVNVLRQQSGYMLGNSNIRNEEALCHAVHEFSTALLRKFKML